MAASASAAGSACAARARLRWAGWPLLLAGLFTLALGVGLLFGGESVLGLVSEAATFSQLPDGVRASLRASGTGVIAAVGRPTALQGALLMAVGGIALVAARLLNREAAPAPVSSDEVDARLTPKDEAPEDVGEPDDTHPGQAPPTATLERRRMQEEAEQEKKKKDKDKPSGMFG